MSSSPSTIPKSISKLEKIFEKQNKNWGLCESIKFEDHNEIKRKLVEKELYKMRWGLNKKEQKIMTIFLKLFINSYDDVDKFLLTPKEIADDFIKKFFSQ